MSEPLRIRPPERDAILGSLRAGVVPGRGLRHIQVGRAREIEALVGDLDRVKDGGSSVRFVIGRYGAGKTFFMQLIRTIALEKKMVTVHADLTPDRRLHATGGQARALYSEMMANAATRTQPEGGAISAIIERFATSAVQEAKDTGADVQDVIRVRLESLTELPGGYDFAHVVGRYWHAYENGDDELRAAAIQWFRGEFANKTEASRALGVRSITIIDDSNVYESLKLFAQFVRLAGYTGLLVCLDEMVNLHRIGNSQARRSNYEQILHIVNNGLQGGAKHLGVIMSGTPEFLTDTRRGLYSYEALQTRLAENTFAGEGIVDVSGTVIRLDTLSPEDIYVLLTKLVAIYSIGRDKPIIDDAAVRAFITHCNDVIGASYFQTPRNTIKSFIDLLSVLDQNPDLGWEMLLARIDKTEIQDNPAALDGDDEMADFVL
jgi:hypothetical protein